MVRRDNSRNDKKNTGKNDSRNRNNDYKKQKPLKERFKENSRENPKGNLKENFRDSSKGNSKNSSKGSLKDSSKERSKEAKSEPVTYGLSAEDWLMPVSVSVETEAQLKAVMDIKAVSRIYVDEACFGIPEMVSEKDGIGSKGAKELIGDSRIPKNKVEKHAVTEDEYEAEAFAEIFKSIRASGKECGLRLRRIERDTDPFLNSRKLLENLVKLGAAPDAVLIRSFDEAMMLSDTEPSEHKYSEQRPSETGNKGLNTIKKIFDYTCYGYNTEAVSMLLDLGAEGLTYPIELTGRECMGLRKSLKENESDERLRTVPYEALVYGHLPMMVSANCIQRTSDRCDHRNRILRLRDRMQKDMPVRCYCKYCYNQIFNAEPLVLYDLEGDIRALEPESVRYDFTIEPEAEVLRILSGAIPKAMTRGHFRHGIE